jgi:hypothetical protein
MRSSSLEYAFLGRAQDSSDRWRFRDASWLTPVYGASFPLKIHRDAASTRTTLVTRRSLSGVINCSAAVAKHAGSSLLAFAMRSLAHRQNSERSQSAQVTGESYHQSPVHVGLEEAAFSAILSCRRQRSTCPRHLRRPRHCHESPCIRTRNSAVASTSRSPAERSDTLGWSRWHRTRQRRNLCTRSGKRS